MALVLTPLAVGAGEVQTPVRYEGNDATSLRRPNLYASQQGRGTCQRFLRPLISHGTIVDTVTPPVPWSMFLSNNENGNTKPIRRCRFIAHTADLSALVPLADKSAVCAINRHLRGEDRAYEYRENENACTTGPGSVRCTAANKYRLNRGVLLNLHAWSKYIVPAVHIF